MKLVLENGGNFELIISEKTINFQELMNFALCNYLNYKLWLM